MKKNNDKYYPNILIFYMAYKMNRHKDKPEYFYELKKLLIEHSNIFGRSLNYNFWQILMTYYFSVKLPMEDIISIYDHILENNVYKRNSGEDFNVIMFKNIVCVSTAAERSKWFENFIEKYSGELSINHRENMHNFSLAHLNLSKGKFKEALEYVNKIDYDIFLLKMDVRIILFEIYFELSCFEQAYSLIHSTFNFLKSTNKFSESRKNLHLTIFKYFKELLKLKSSNEFQSYAVLSLKRKVTEESFFQRQWLLKKIEEMQSQTSNMRRETREMPSARLAKRAGRREM